MQLYWGDFHRHVESAETAERALAATKGHLDVYPVVFYPYHRIDVNGLTMESVRPEPEHADVWQEIRSVVEQHRQRSDLVTAMGLEWHGDRERQGDYNVFYFNRTPTLTYPDSLPGLYRHLGEFDGIAIPHHIAYAVGHCGANWDALDSRLSPAIDIFSAHGCSEADMQVNLLPYNAQMGPGVSGGTAQDALNRGLKVGMIASNDGLGLPGSWGLGLTGIWADELTPASILASLQKRHVYAVTGDRIHLSFSVNGQPMGSILKKTDTAEIYLHVIGSSAIDYIEIIRNGRVLSSYCHAAQQTSLPASGERIRGKFRFQFGWGPAADKGFQVLNKLWQVTLTLRGGRIIDTETCFTDFGQSILAQGEDCCRWQMTTRPSRDMYSRNEAVQSIIFEIDGDSAAKLELDVDGESFSFSFLELLTGSRLIPLMNDAAARIKQQFGLDRQQLLGHDPLFHSAFKVRIEGVLSDQYNASHTLTDAPDPDRENYYYVRVKQSNGQMAWSSPIWVEGA